MRLLLRRLISMETRTRTAANIIGCSSGEQLTSYGNWGPNGIYGSPFGCLDNQIHVNWVCTGLQPNTAYHCRLDIYGPTRYCYGGDTNFTTLPLAPTVSTEAATITNAFSVVLAGSVNPNGATTTAWYQWGLDASCTNSTAATSLGNGNGSFNVPYTLTNLSASTRYYYQIVAGNRGGTNNGAIQSVTTGPPPPPVIQSIAWRSGEISSVGNPLLVKPIRSNTRPI